AARLRQHEGADRNDPVALLPRIRDQALDQRTADALPGHAVGHPGMVGTDLARSAAGEGQFGLALQAGDAGDIAAMAGVDLLPADLDHLRTPCRWPGRATAGRHQRRQKTAPPPSTAPTGNSPWTAPDAGSARRRRGPD